MGGPGSGPQKGGGGKSKSLKTPKHTPKFSTFQKSAAKRGGVTKVGRRTVARLYKSGGKLNIMRR